VFDKNKKLVYQGDTDVNRFDDKDFRILKNYSVSVCRSFLTNGYTGVLTMSSGLNFSGMYHIGDGELIYDQRSEQPVTTITQKSGFKIGVIGGAPFQSITLLCTTNINDPPHEEVLTLDAVGSLTWTNTMNSAMGFFSTRYPQLEESKPSIAR
jgi:hypothetical protein